MRPQGFLGGSAVKNLPTIQEPWEVWEGTAAHSSILAWRILWTEEPGGLQSVASQRIG